MAKTKTKFNPADYKEQQKKKLNVGYVPGFHYDIVYEEVEGHGFETVRENALVEDVIRYLDNKQTKYIGALVPNHDCLCIGCNSLAFKLLGFKTLWAYEPMYDNYIYYFQYDQYYIDYLAKHLTSYKLSAEWDYALFFTKTKMPKLCPAWQQYHLTSLPKMTESLAEKIIQVNNDIINNNGYYYQINQMKDTYRIPQAVCGRMAKTVLPYSTITCLEAILQVCSHSSAIIVNSELHQPYRFDIINFMLLMFTDDDIADIDNIEDYITDDNLEMCERALNDLVDKGYIDKFSIDENVLTFTSAFITRHVRQQIKRSVHYFGDLPAQRPYVATFINYLWWIQQAGHKQLTIALDTLLANLNLERLLREHRNGEIAEILNILHKWAVKYNLIEHDEIHPEITSDDVKYLKKNRTKLHEYFKLQSLNIGGKENDSRN